MLQASGLGCSRGGRDLFMDIDFEVNGGDALRIGGRNGSGKTSLLRILCGLSQPCRGEVRWQGQPIGPLARGLLARCVVHRPRQRPEG